MNLPCLNLRLPLSDNIGFFNLYQSVVEREIRKAVYLTARTEQQLTGPHKEFLFMTDPNAIVWNWNYLVVEYHIPRYITLSFTRVYKKDSESYFTLSDILERILQFYQTGLTREEYADIYGELQERISREPNLVTKTVCSTLWKIMDLPQPFRKLLSNDNDLAMEIVNHHHGFEKLPQCFSRSTRHFKINGLPIWNKNRCIPPS